MPTQHDELIRTITRAETEIRTFLAGAKETLATLKLFPMRMNFQGNAQTFETAYRETITGLEQQLILLEAWLAEIIREKECNPKSAAHVANHVLNVLAQARNAPPPDRPLH